jgi:hypothetical protein
MAMTAAMYSGAAGKFFLVLRRTLYFSSFSHYSIQFTLFWVLTPFFGSDTQFKV